MSGRVEQTNFAKTISVDLTRLQKIVVNNISGPTYIVGTNAAQVALRAQTSSGQFFTPGFEFKQDGSRLEIGTETNSGWNFNFQMESDAPSDYADEEPTSEERREEYRREYREQHRQERRDARRERNFLRDLDPTQVGELVGDFAMNFGRMFEKDSVELYLEIPWGVELEVKTMSGAVEVRDMGGFCRINSTSGAVNLNHLTGGLSLKNMSGRLEAVELAGRVSVKVISGSVNLWKCHISSLDLSVTSGRVAVETDLGSQSEDSDYRLNTTSGQVELRLPASAAVSVDCRTLSGRLALPANVNPAGTRYRPGQSQARFDLNGGGRRVSINTLSGNIELALTEASGESFRPAPMPPVPPSPAWPTTLVPPTPDFGSVPVVPPTPAFRPVAATMPPTAPANSVSPSPAFTQVAADQPEATSESPSPREATVEPVRPITPSPTPVEDTTDKKARQLEILQRLERGELSIADGMTLLNGLDNN